MNLTKKGASSTVAWTAKHEHVFDESKERLAEPPVLRAPDMSKPLVARTDTSNSSLGAVLLQEVEEILDSLVYASRKLSEKEKRYSATERIPGSGLDDS